MIQSRKSSGGLLRRGPPLALVCDCLSIEAPRAAMCQVPQTLEATLATTLATLGIASMTPGIIPLQQSDKTCDVSRVFELCGGGGIYSPGNTAHPPR